ncbi:MAG: hypothetical protein B0D92_01495 [Spirochaeta sp. LUC14_002_19_P3]|nr:MAG: hypothetical protein B0D92_01495 [Spirochaeta sp. LUC14_002_19_P3]
MGDWVLAAGSPFGYENSVTLGIVSAVERYSGPKGNINGFIQTDAAINQGNSGGPLVNLKGEIIGINTFITTPNSGSIGLGFAIPSNNVQRFVQRLIEFGEVRYGWLGASLGLYDDTAAEALGYPMNYGVMVYQVFIGSPAEKAKLQPGDLILSLDGQRYTDDSKLIYQIGDKAPGSKAVFRIERFGEELDITVTLGERQKEEEVYAMHGLSWPGFVPAPLNDRLRELLELPDSLRGVPVAIIYPHSPSQAVDLRAGDVIIRVGSTVIDSIQDCYLALGTVPKDKLELTVYRDGEEINLRGAP